MDVDAIMTKKVVTVSMDDSLKTIRDLFSRKRFHHLLVIVDERGVHRLAGLISDRDLFRALSPNADKEWAGEKDLVTLNKKAHQIMSRHPTVLRSGTPVRQAVDVIIEKGLSCLPVVNDSGEAIGIVSWKDLLRYFAILRKDI